MENFTKELDTIKSSKEYPVLDIPKDLIFPNELNKYFKEHLQNYIHENGMLKKYIQKLETKVKDSQIKEECVQKEMDDFKSLNSVDPNCNFVSSTNTIVRSKIVELGKKLREKTSELEFFKSKYVKIERQLNNLKSKEPGENLSAHSKIKEPKRSSENDLKALQSKLSQTTNRMFEEKNANLALKNEIKLLKSLVKDETGQSVENLLQVEKAESKGWKGRAEIILELQHKVMELKEKLKIFQEKGEVNIDAKPSQILSNKNLEKLESRNKELKARSEELKEKFDKEHKKSKNLQLECCISKHKLINLANQLDMEREQNALVLDQSTQAVNRQTEVIGTKDTQIEKLKQNIKELQITLKRYECEIENLKENHKLNTPSTAKNRSAEQERNENYDLDQILNDSNKKALKSFILELIESSKSKLSKEHSEKQRLEELYMNEKQKVFKLQSKLNSKQYSNVRSGQSSYTSIIEQRNVERSEFSEVQFLIAEEKLKALETKLQIEKREREKDLQEFKKILQNFNS